MNTKSKKSVMVDSLAEAFSEVLYGIIKEKKETTCLYVFIERGDTLSLLVTSIFDYYNFYVGCVKYDVSGTLQFYNRNDIPEDSQTAFARALRQMEI